VLFGICCRGYKTNGSLVFLSLRTKKSRRNFLVCLLFNQASNESFVWQSKDHEVYPFFFPPNPSARGKQAFFGGVFFVSDKDQLRLFFQEGKVDIEIGNVRKPTQSVEAP
jgi:hypothetical protein